LIDLSAAAYVSDSSIQYTTLFIASSPHPNSLRTNLRTCGFQVQDGFGRCGRA